VTTASIEPETADLLANDEYQPYRAVSKAAVLSLALVFLSLLAIVFPMLLVLPATGLLLGLLARRNLRRYPRELTGRGIAWVGTVGCGLLLVGGSIYHLAVYLTEVPEGYERITFESLQVGEEDLAAGTNLPLDLNGQRVFVKGYVHPGVSSMGKIRRFVLVPDMGTCCFGGQPALTDMIEVRIVGDAEGVRYSTRKQRLAGTFHVRTQLRKVAGGLTGGYYELEADYVK
jgi:hypothetical protein